MDNANDFIIIRGARENNLKNIDINIPKGKIVVFAGASGSGKSSLVFNTVASEAMRELYDTFPLYVRNRMPYYPAADVEEIENLTTPIIVRQRPVTGDFRSTVGTLTGVSPMLRLLFSRCASPHLNLSSAYSFNDPAGMCPSCKGTGRITKFDLNKIFDKNKSLMQGAIQLPGFQVGSYQWQVYANSGFFDCEKPLNQYSENEWDLLLHGSGKIVSVNNTTGSIWAKSYNTKYEGLLDKIERLYLKKSQSAVKGTARKILRDFTVTEACESCHGKRLNDTVLNSRLNGFNIWELGELEISDLMDFLNKRPEDLGKETVSKISEVLENICSIGLGYLTLNRETRSLSGGEAQRLKIISHLTGSLTGLIYIFDEPSRGLHPKDIDRLNNLLLQLKKKGNSILVVEHDRSVMEIADEIVELGPGAGSEGGNIVFQGTLQELSKANTLTGKWLRKPLLWNVRKEKNDGADAMPNENRVYRIEHCSENNLQDVSVVIPKNQLTVISGVAGAGKTTLACVELPKRIPEAIRITQDPVGATERSTPGTYLGVMDDIRKTFAKANNVVPGMFSFNAKGACPDCKGKGVIETEMAFLDPVISVCETCGGSRFSSKALSYTLHEKNIHDILKMTIAEAAEFFKEYKFAEKLHRLIDVGLEYITLGQPTSTMSGGELQRLKLASRLKSKGAVYVMDEPSTGLHGEDVSVLMRLIRQLVNNGNTVVAVDNDFDVIAEADHIIDLGPEGGKDGGTVIFEGSIEELLETKNRSYTAEYFHRELTAR